MNNMAHDLSEYNYQSAQAKAAAIAEMQSIISAVDSLIQIDYPEEDIEWFLIQNMSDRVTKEEFNEIEIRDIMHTVREVMRLKQLDFSKEQLVRIKAKKLADQGTSTNQICSVLYDQLKGRVSKQMIRLVCSKLGYTDSRFKNRR